MLNLTQLLAGSPFQDKAKCLAIHFTQAGITADNVADIPGRVGRNICGCDVHSLTAFLVEKLKQPVVAEVQAKEPEAEVEQIAPAMPAEEPAPEPPAEPKRRSKQ